MPSRIQSPCLRLPGGLALNRHAACMWAMTNGISWQALPQAWARWLPPTATSAKQPIQPDGERKPLLILREPYCNCLQRPKIANLGLHWFRRGFGRGVVHVELNVLVNLIQKKLTANTELLV